MLTIGRQWGQSIVLHRPETGEVIAVIELAKRASGSTGARLRVNAPQEVRVEFLESYAAGGGEPLPQGLSMEEFEEIEAQWEARLAEKDRQIKELYGHLHGVRI